MSLSPEASAINNIDVSAKSCVLMYEDGQCIYEKNADERQLIASTTKIMTSIICIEKLKLDNTVKIKPEYCLIEGSSMYLEAGERYTVRDLLLGLLLASGNDAALALADYAAGSEQAFAELMNEKAETLGMSNSHFVNPHGLDAKGHYSSAKDMAKLMLYCIENKTFRELVSCYSVNVKGNVLTNHNKMLKTYPGCIGGKTGFTAAAGRCLVSCAEKNGMRFVCVTLSAPDDWNDHIKLYDYAFSQYMLKNISNEAKFDIPVISGSKKTVSVMPKTDVQILVNHKAGFEIKTEFPVFIFAPVKIGETAGKICVIIKDNVVAEIPLVYAENVAAAYPCFNMAGVEVSL